MTNWTISKDNLQARIAVERERRRRQHRAAPTSLWHPQPGPQTLALASTADVIGFGGAAGGGKTDLLLGAAGTKHHRSIIFRRLFPNVRGIIERSREIFARDQSHSKDSYNESLHVWRLADKRYIEMASMQYEKDKEKYRGRAYDLHCFDELTEFTESQFRFVTAWNRTARTDVQPQVIATFNPPMDDDGMWVLKYFGPWIDPDYTGERAAPGELRWYAIDEEGNEVEVEEGTPNARSRTFIPSRLEDNSYLMAAGYDRMINSLPEPLRSSLKGNFTARTNDDPWRVIPAVWYEQATARWSSDGGYDALGAIGVDVARGGKDATTLAHRFGQWIAPLLSVPGAQTPDGPSVAALVIQGWQDGARVLVDVIGVGSSAYDHLAPVVPTTGVNVSEASRETDRTGLLRFGNVRAELWWRMREALDPEHGDTLALPPDPELRQELLAPRFFVRSGKIWVESKDDVRARIGRSTDKADAVILAVCADPGPLFLFGGA